MKSIFAALVLATPLALASCEGALDDVLGEWSRPTPGNNNNNTTTSTTIEHVEYTVSGTTASSSTKSLAEGEYTAVTSSLSSLSADKPYVVNDDITLDGNVNLTGDAKIILCDGKTLTINGYLGDSTFPQTYSLSIYGQSGQTGKLIVKTTDGSYPIMVYDLKIHGGNISSKDVGTGYDTQGIFTEHNFDIYNGKIEAFGTMEGVMVNGGGTLTTYGGSLEATTSASIFASGAGSEAIAGSVIMNGGTITATGGDATASSMPGGDAIYGTLTVNGGTLTATGGAGVGTIGGCGIVAYDLEINGGTVTAIGNVAEGILVDNITLNGGNVSVTGGTNANAIVVGYTTSGSMTITSDITSVELTISSATTNKINQWILENSGAASFKLGTTNTYIGTTWSTLSIADGDSGDYDSSGISISRSGLVLTLQ